MFFKDPETGSRILSTTTSQESKALSRDIKNFNYDIWRDVTKEQCEEGITCKFLQNSLLQKMLLETSNKQIVECCYDTLWVTGLPLHEDTCLNPALWHNQGIMGEILENIHEKITVPKPNASCASSEENTAQEINTTVDVETASM